MADSIPRHDIMVIRGDPFEKDIALVEGFEDIRELSYSARMVFRTEQSDEMPNVLVLTADPEVPEPEEDAFAYLSFAATPDQTSSLPGYDIVYFTELVWGNGDPAGRLLQGKVRIRD